LATKCPRKEEEILREYLWLALISVGFALWGWFRPGKDDARPAPGTEGYFERQRQIERRMIFWIGFALGLFTAYGLETLGIVRTQ
jgi:hypothetical protein